MTKRHLLAAVIVTLAASHAYAEHPRERRISGDYPQQLRVHVDGNGYHRSPQRAYSNQYHTRTHWRHQRPGEHYSRHYRHHRRHVRDRHWDRHHRHDRYCEHRHHRVNSGVRLHINL